MMNCDHYKSKVYAKKTFANGTVHYCIQCIKCLNLVTLEGQKGQWIKLEDIPENRRHNIRDHIPRKHKSTEMQD